MAKAKESKKKKVSEAGLNNLKPIRSEEEARELGRRGGVASGQARRENRDLKKKLELASDILTDKLKRAALKRGDKELAKEIEEVGVIVFTLMDIATSNKIKAETRLKALSEVMDRTDGKPIQRNELTGKDGQPIESVNYTQEELIEWREKLKNNDDD